MKVRDILIKNTQNELIYCKNLSLLRNFLVYISIFYFKNYFSVAYQIDPIAHT